MRNSNQTEEPEVEEEVQSLTSIDKQDGILDRAIYYKSIEEMTAAEEEEEKKKKETERIKQLPPKERRTYKKKKKENLFNLKIFYILFLFFIFFYSLVFSTLTSISLRNSSKECITFLNSLSLDNS